MSEDQQGFHVEQDELGRFTEGTTLSSERAREIRSGPHRKRGEKEADELAKIVLATLPDLDDPKRQRVRDELLRHYCRHATSNKGASALTAIEGIARLIGEAFASKPGPSMLAPGPDDACPLCQRVDARTLSLTAEARAYLRRLVRENAAMLLTNITEV